MDEMDTGRDSLGCVAEPAEDSSLVVPRDLADYAFPHDVQVAPDGSRAFFELTRVDMPANRYRTDIWAIDAATNEPRRLTTSGEEGHYQVCDDGRVLFVSKRRTAAEKASGKRAASAAPAKTAPTSLLASFSASEPPAAACCDPARATDLFLIDPAGGEAQLVATIPGRAVSDWRQLDKTRFVLRCREKADPSSPVIEIEDVPFYENGGTYMAGTRWGLWLLDLARLDVDLVAGPAALRPLTLPDEEVGDWALSQDRARVVFASRRYAGLRPTTDKLWALELATPSHSAAPDAASDDAGGAAEADDAAVVPAPCAVPVASVAVPMAGEPLAPTRTLVDDAPYRRSRLAPFRGGVLYLATDMRANGINEDPHPWWAPLDGSAMPVRIEESEPDLYYGCAVGGDSSYGSGLEAKPIDDAWYFLSTEFDHVYLRRMDADGAMERIVAEPGAIECFDTVDGRTFWYVAARGCDLPEVYRLDLDVPAPSACLAGSSEPASADASEPAGAPMLADPAVRERRLTRFSDVLVGKRLSAPESFTFESNGDTLTGYVLAPAGYKPDDGRSYPGVLEVHGGPKAAYGTAVSQEMQCLAARGYFVFFTNPHGSAGHGVAFSDIRGRYGQEDYGDLMAFTDEVLRRYPAIDAGRLAVMGGSYGGFMTNWVIGHTDRFRCANSQRSIANYMTKCLDSDIGYWVNMPETTAWLPDDADVDLAGTQGDSDETAILPVVGEDCVRGASAGASNLPPVESLAFVGDNPRRLWEQSPLAFAGNVTTPTLFLHSDEDYRCPLNEGMQMFTALQLRGVPSRLVIFKGESHGLCRAGKPQNRVRRLEEILAWYRRWLDGDGTGAPAASVGAPAAAAPTVR